jgi:hypothetical protein
MKYKLDLREKLDVSSTPASGYAGPLPTPFYAWQPSTWPAAPAAVDEAFILTLKRIFEDSILIEINNVIEDAKVRTGSLEHRGHVVAIALLCALDAISSYGYGPRNGRQIPPFVRAHFSGEYHAHAPALLRLYRHAMVHSWNLFQATLLPGNEPIATSGSGTVAFGLLNFYEALQSGTIDYLNKLETSAGLQRNTLNRYRALKRSARA